MLRLLQGLLGTYLPKPRPVSQSRGDKRRCLILQQNFEEAVQYLSELTRLGLRIKQIGARNSKKGG